MSKWYRERRKRIANIKIKYIYTNDLQKEHIVATIRNKIIMSNLSFLAIYLISIIDQGLLEIFQSSIRINSILFLVSSIGCYKCSSVNGSNPLCEDNFQGDIAGKTPLLHAPCLTNLRGRKGLFPATHCIKLIAYPKSKKNWEGLIYSFFEKTRRQINAIYLSNM